MKVKNWGLIPQALLAMRNKVAAFEQKSQIEYRNIVKRTLFELADASPQWSGRFAASWRVNIGYFRGAGGRFVSASTQVDTSYGEGGYMSAGPGLGTEPKFRGDSEAVYRAMYANSDIIQKIKLNTPVSFFNAVPYAEIVMENEDPYDPGWKLRPGNYRDPTPIPIAYVRSKMANWV